MLFAGLGRDERRERARRALSAVGLAHRLDHRPDQLSGGERQRVAIARSVVMGPKLLLADEPTGNLDSRSAGEVMELLEAMNRDGLTLVVVTHDQEVAARANRVVRMRDGALEEVA
jgi:putative ABC transport system ATP-binding protein